MKKIMMISAVFLLLSSQAFGAATLNIGTFADAGKVLHGDDTGASATSPSIGRLSTGVGLAMAVDTAGGGYALATQHKNGTRAFGSSYDSTAIYTQNITIGTAFGTLSATDTSDFSGWDKL